MQNVGSSSIDTGSSASVNGEKKGNSILAVQCIKNVWVSGERASRSKNFFDKHKIKAVINLSSTIPNFFNFDSSIEYLRIPVYDSAKKRDWYLYYMYGPIISEFIYKNAVIEDKPVLVHCRLGSQRSSAALALYLIKFYNMSADDAIKFILKKKPDTFHNGKSVNFYQALQKWSSKYYDP
jgi:protein-tyrosine phosphatase